MAIFSSASETFKDSTELVETLFRTEFWLELYTGKIYFAPQWPSLLLLNGEKYSQFNPTTGFNPQVSHRDEFPKGCLAHGCKNIIFMAALARPGAISARGGVAPNLSPPTVFNVSKFFLAGHVWYMGPLNSKYAIFHILSHA